MQTGKTEGFSPDGPRHFQPNLMILWNQSGLKILSPLKTNPPFCPSPQPLTTPFYYVTESDCSAYTHRSRLGQYLPFCDWLFLSRISWSFIQSAACQNFLPFQDARTPILRIYSIHWMLDLLSWIMLLWAWMYRIRFVFLLPFLLTVHRGNLPQPHQHLSFSVLQ